MLQQASNLEYAETGRTSIDMGPTSQDWYDNFFKKRFNIVSSMPSSSSKAVNEGWRYSGDITFYTADGMAFSIEGHNSFCAITIDVNGDKKPNKFTLSKDDLKDGYTIGLQSFNNITGDYMNGAAVVALAGPAACIIEGNSSRNCAIDLSENQLPPPPPPPPN
ncbi:MAG: hypothetical protein PHV37_05170 [Candidatus Gastranaerophilales bacterium]|nr:hypothetical protein [Candidatus Gastranaerophilales bacterium]